jgi:hypothetical protein
MTYREVMECEMQPYGASVGENKKYVKVFVELGEMVQLPLDLVCSGTTRVPREP